MAESRGGLGDTPTPTLIQNAWRQDGCGELAGIKQQISCCLSGEGEGGLRSLTMVAPLHKDWLALALLVKVGGSPAWVMPLVSSLLQMAEEKAHLFQEVSFRWAKEGQYLHVFLAQVGGKTISSQEQHIRQIRDKTKAGVMQPFLGPKPAGSPSQGLLAAGIISPINAYLLPGV